MRSHLIGGEVVIDKLSSLRGPSLTCHPFNQLCNLCVVIIIIAVIIVIIIVNNDDHHHCYQS